MARKILETEIVDDYGKAHEYAAITLPTEDELAIGLVIADVLGDGLGKAMSGVGNMFRALAGRSVDDAALDTPVDLSGFAAIPSRLITHGGPALVRRILTGCKRVDVDDKGRRIVSSVDQKGDFDDVYSANLGELTRAVEWLLRQNYGPFLMALLDRLKGLFATSAQSVDTKATT
jgi:hypothetical protein